MGEHVDADTKFSRLNHRFIEIDVMAGIVKAHRRHQPADSSTSDRDLGHSPSLTPRPHNRGVRWSLIARGPRMGPRQRVVTGSVHVDHDET